MIPETKTWIVYRAKARVVRLESGDGYLDKTPRAMLQIEGAMRMTGAFEIPNIEGLKLDDMVELEIAR